jgi:outer membrane receptor for ferrienterochelin and colicins
MQVNKSLFFFFSIFLFSNSAIAQIPRLNLIHEATNQPVQYAHVQWRVVGTHGEMVNAVSDENGILTLPAEIGERIVLSITCVGFKQVKDTLRLKAIQTIDLEEDIFNLEQITITGTRTAHTLKDAPVLTQMISRKEIERIDAITIADILRAEVPGIEIGRHGYGMNMSIQGLEPQYALFLIDGERMAGETGGNVDYSRINAANIEKIEIVRGASSALYGSNAMGGVINIITKKPLNKIEVTANLRYAQRNQKNYDDNKYYDEAYERTFYKNQDKPNLNGNLVLGFRNKRYYSNTFINFKSMDGYVLEDKESLRRFYENADTVVQDPLGTSSINGTQDFTITQKIGYDDGGKWAFELRGNVYRHEEFLTRVYNWVHDLFKSYTLGGFAKYRITQEKKLQVFYNMDIYDKYDVYERKSNLSALNYRNTFHNLRLSYELPLGTRHNLFFGTEYLHEILETDMFVSDASSLKTESAGDAVVVFQDEFTVTKKFQTILGVRAGNHSTFDYHASPSVTLKYALNPFNLRLNYAKGYRSPTLKELYMNWSHLGMFQIIGSTDLEPETNDYFAFSADYLNINKNINATVIASYNQISDKIDGIWESDSTVNYVNLGEVKVFNFETILKWRIHDYFNFKGGYVYTNQNRDEEAVALSEVSPHAITAQLEFFYSKGKYNLSANLSGKYFSKKAVEGENEDESSPLFGEFYEIRYPAYSLWNLTLNQQYGRHFLLNMGLKNLFNYTAPTVTMNTTPSIGRRYFVSVGYRL